ncbi:MAG: DUF2779 domain-containing protein [Candidatus Izemoplasmatales bacterium]
MIITTIDLLNYLRCRRYAALDSRMSARQMNSSSQDDKYLALKCLSVKNNYQSTVDEDDPDETVQKKQLHAEVTSKAVYAIKAIAYAKIQSLYPDVMWSQNQKITVNFASGDPLLARLDLMGFYSDTLYAFTVLPVTDKELINWKYNLGKTKYQFFTKNEQGIYTYKKTKISTTIHSNFSDRLEKLTDRRNDSGRHFFDLAFKAYILHKLYPHQTIKSYLVMLNHQYVYDGNPDLQPKADFNLISLFDVSAIIADTTETIEIDLYRMLNHINLNDDSPCQLVKNECQKNTSFECQFADYCFSHIPKNNSIFHYFQQHLGFAEGPKKTDICHDTYDLINEGVVDMLDIPISWLQREKNLMQRYCVENDYTFINKPKVKAILDTLCYPLYYLDFEAYPAIIPRFRGESPYSQSVFQFSVHVQTKRGYLEKNNPKTHFEYIDTSEGDHREDLIKSLLLAIPEGDSSVIVYNKTFEKNRLMELATMFPAYAKRLNEIASRLFDLLRVLKNDYDFFAARGFPKEIADSYNYYHPQMGGSYSLKKVLPLFDASGYEGLPIANGMMAYLQYARFGEIETSERQSTINNLLAYCQQDTYSMYVILKGLESML